MTAQGIVVLGIPVPSTSPVFLAVVGLHVGVGLTCVVSGLTAILSAKRSGCHPAAGTVCYWSLALVFATMSVLSVMRWPEDVHLFVLGILSFAAASIGRAARRARWHGWLAHHVIGMTVSYVVLITAFYVDNGPNLPLWSHLPQLAFWLAPGLVGLPILIRVLLRHPLLVQRRRLGSEGGASTK